MDLVSDTCNDNAQVTARLELHALEKQARLLCDHTQQLAVAARSRGVPRSREADLQTEVFAERRARVMQLLETTSTGIDEPRMARLEKLIEALGFSRSYFMKV